DRIDLKTKVIKSQSGEQVIEHRDNVNGSVLAGIDELGGAGILEERSAASAAHALGLRPPIPNRETHCSSSLDVETRIPAHCAILRADTRPPPTPGPLPVCGNPLKAAKRGEQQCNSIQAHSACLAQRRRSRCTKRVYHSISSWCLLTWSGCMSQSIQ